MWTRQTKDNTVTFCQDNISYSLAANPEDLNDECKQYMLDEIYANSDPHLALQKTILYASEKRSDYISPTYDSIVIPYNS